MAYTETARKKFRSLIGLSTAVALGRVTLTMPQINAHVTNSDTFKVPGARPGDLVFVMVESGSDGLYVQSAKVTDIGTVTLKVGNATAANVATAAATFAYRVVRG